MVSSSGDTLSFEPLDLSADALPLDAPLDPQIALSGGTTFGSGPLPGLPDLGSIGDLITFMESVINDLTGALSLVESAHPARIFPTLMQYFRRGLGAMDPSAWLPIIAEIEMLPPPSWDTYVSAAGNAFEWVVSLGGGLFYSSLLKLGLDVDLTRFEPDAQRGVKTTDQLIGFAMALPFFVSALMLIFKLPLANRFPESALEGIREIPEEMGLSWALGITIEKAFEAAVGESVMEGIRRAKRPNTPEWQIARAMLKQHVISDDKLTEILEKAGYSDDWITAIKKLESQPLPVGDIQAMWQSGVIDDKQVDQFLIALGFSDDIRPLIKELYVDKAETSAGAEIRSVSRALFRQSLITETDYRANLDRVHYPEKMIADDIYAINMEKDTGWKQQQITVVKSQYLHNLNTFAPTVQKLQVLGYPHDVATDMVTSWTAPPIRREHGLSEAQVLSYYVSGLLSAADTRTKLTALGLDSDTVSFLVAHPTSKAGVRVQKLTPQLVVRAYTNGLITQDTLYTQLQQLGLAGDHLDYVYRNAIWAYAHHKNPGSGTTTLDKGEVRDAYKLGIMTESDALLALENMGYSPDNALILLEITNKGPITVPPAPAFPTLQAAVDYLERLGFTFQGSQDPTYLAALNMVEQSGLQPQAPANFVPPTVLPNVILTGSTGGTGQPGTGFGGA